MQQSKRPGLPFWANAQADAAEERAAAAIAEAHARARAVEQKAEAAIAEANARAAAAEEKSTALVCHANAHFKALEEQLAQALGKLHATPLPGTMAESEVVAVIGESAAEEAAQEESPEELTGGCADVQCNGIHRLINLLDKHSSNPEVCSQACRALESLILKDAGPEAKVADLGGVELILHVLETHPHEATYLLLPVLETLRSLTFHEKSVDRATAANGASRVLAFLAKNLCAPELLGGACAVLLKLSVIDKNRHQIAHCGGAAVLARAIREHRSREQVVEPCCQILNMLACHQELRPLVLAADGNLSAAAVACSA